MTRNSIYVVFAACILLGLWSCKGFEGASVTANPDPLVVIADSIKYDIKVLVPPKSGFKKKGVYTGEAKIGSSSQGKLNIDSQKYSNIKKTGVDTTLKFHRPFFEDMDNNDLMIAQSYERKGKTFELTDIRDLAQCCITTSRLLIQNDQVIMSQHNYQKEVPLRIEAKFNFPKNVSDISEDQYNKADIRQIGDFLKAKNVATKITVVGFASPEGPYKRNVMLSTKRSEEVIVWLTEQLKAEGYESYLDSSFFQISTSAQDWAGFQQGIASYPPDVRAQISEIVVSGLEENEKESQIMALVGGKDKVEYILAPLRRATIVVEGNEPRRTDAEIDKIAADFIAGKFSGNLKDTYEQEEWLYAVTRVEEMTQKAVLLEAYRQAYPSDFRAFNDLGAIELKIGDNEKALDYLEDAYKLNNQDYAINNNIGVAYKNERKLMDAKRYYEASLASRATPEANFNMGIVLEKMGMFNEAVSRFNQGAGIMGAEYNAGLCKVMLDDYTGAKASLNSSISKMNDKSALPYYLMAVIGARTSDASLMSINLKKACTIDDAMKMKAPKDLEFRKYFNAAEFKAAIK